MAKTVFLTGSFGSIGTQILKHLLDLEYRVICFDIKNNTNEKKQRQLAKKHRFDVVWGDLSNRIRVLQAVTAQSPDIIIHCAAVIPPMSYLDPDLAYKVNVDGTKYLIAAASTLPHKPKFIFTSSYAIYGPRNPLKETNPLTVDTPINPKTNYAEHKVEGEAMLRASALPWTILRLCAVYSPDGQGHQHPAVLKFLFELPWERREHAIDSRDAALAVANAIAADTVNKIFLIGGGEESWKREGGDFITDILKAQGLPVLPKEAFRKADPEVTDSWFHEDWIDTRESQRVLAYQQHSFEDHLKDLQRYSGISKYFYKSLSSIILKQMLKDSPYFGKPQKIDSRPFWKAVEDALIGTKQN